jgi:predicted dehydrogenase
LNDFAKSRCLVIGYGSIGARHARILEELGCNVAVVSRRTLDTITSYTDVAEAVLRQDPDYVVIANETALHYDALVKLSRTGYKGRVLMEKPLFERMREVPENRFLSLRVAYNLRFHPVIANLKSLLIGQEILSAQGYVGQYLPDWRPGTDFRNSYSARAELGGGVLLDLSHDLDYLTWMLGDCQRITALGGHLSPLEITSDDVFTLLASFSRCPVATLQLNYLDRRGRRQLVVNTACHTYEADLIENKIIIDRTEQLYTVERDDTYRSMHVALLNDEQDRTCSIEEALSILRIVDASRRSAKNHEWVTQ